MKASVLVVEAVDGTMHSVAGPSSVPFLEMIPVIRASGTVKIAGQHLAVKCGAVLSTWRSKEEFRCNLPPADEAKGKRGKK